MIAHEKPDSSNIMTDDSGFSVLLEKKTICFDDSGGTDETASVFMADEYSSSMDLAWRLNTDGCFLDWASTLVRRQIKGRGQFGREWISPDGNMYGSIRLPSFDSRFRDIIFLLAAGTVHGVLTSLGFTSEFKWPNDILVCRKKVGGILIEERAGIIIAGIGINIVSAPASCNMRDDSALDADCLVNFGTVCSPFDLWTKVVRAFRRELSHNTSSSTVSEYIRNIEKHMVYIGEHVVFDSHDGKGFPAFVLGLDNSGGIRLKTANGDVTYNSGSVSLKIC